ncbi:Rieske 2Fe-2S domain-containing protein [Bradyrhizobium canariense]|uniref:Rieske [2Fe-2S] domain-containing protein n=1 Tax=Bradyrhizobium canariense TaxID=255045 RepID=A0A1H1SHT1_9BRAD|nr:Rieske 2Fe-2S domain-containing protein [Bradyrhizobium canariense]SDS47574.1 Rieske [2Fe-2S] domain-containing protein [Bradyrhizobium canariense]
MSLAPKLEKMKAIAGPYRGYDQREAPEPDWDLARTGPNTKMGEYMRRFWQPVCLSSQLADLPHLIRVLGEDLVAFRDRSGRVGVVHRHCCHRGTTLEYGRIEENGIRCCYHGWLFDVDGTVLETPGEPPQSRLKQTVFQGAYPAVEYHGLVLAYMGPPELKPPFPEYDLFKIPGLSLYPSAVTHENNWLQTFENNMDPFHGQFLHTRFTPHFGDHYFVLPVVEWKLTADGSGIFYCALRRVDDDLLWVRLFHCIFPNFAFVGSLYDLNMQEPYFQRCFYVRAVVPNDDERTTIYSWRLHGEGEFAGGEPERNGWNSIDIDGQVEQPDYELKQRAPGDWEAQGGQRTIAVHALERLGTTDAGVAMLRRGLRSILAGKVPAAFPVSETNTHEAPLKNIYSSNTVLRIRRRSDPDAERAHLLAVGREIYGLVERADSFSPQDRRDEIIAGMQDIEKRLA